MPDSDQASPGVVPGAVLCKGLEIPRRGTG